MTYSEIVAEYLDNIRMESATECRNLIAAIDALQLVRPTETESGGQRITTRDLRETRNSAQSKLASYQLACNRPVAIVPPNDLR